MKVLITKDLFNTKYNMGQYMDNFDCPIARALKKAGLEVSAENFNVRNEGDIVALGGRRYHTSHLTPWDYRISLEVKADLDSGKIETYVIDYPTLEAPNSHGNN